MKKIRYACLAVLLLVLFLPGCAIVEAHDKALDKVPDKAPDKAFGKTPAEDLVEAPDDWKDLKYVAENFSLEDAKNEGYVVIEDGSVTWGKDSWQSFVALAEKKKPCRFRVVHYYTIKDPSRYDPAYYESIKDEYPKMYIYELDYNGRTFSVSHYEEEKLYQSKYKYLMKYEGKAESRDALYSSYVRFVLVNDDTVTWNDIFYGMVSSRFGDYIPHCLIYSDLVYKDGYLDKDGYE